jgi:hypothetical protein
MSDKYHKWMQQNDMFVLLIPDVAQAIVAPHNGLYQAAVYDCGSQQVVWEGERFASAHGAKTASSAAIKRLGYSTAVPHIETAADQPEPEPIQVSNTERGSSHSIWKPVALRTTLAGKGIEVVCTVKEMDDCFEATTTLGSFVFRDEYPDEWSAKRAAHQWASLLIERHA